MKKRHIKKQVAYYPEIKISYEKRFKVRLKIDKYLSSIVLDFPGLKPGSSNHKLKSIEGVFESINIMNKFFEN